MFKRIFALAAMMAVAACSGGGGGSTNTLPNPGSGSGGGTTQANAKSSATFFVPVNRTMGGAPTTTSAFRTAASARLHPMFIDANSNGAIAVLLDGNNFANVPFAPNGNVSEGQQGPQGSGKLPNGGSYTYDVTYTDTNSQGSGAGNQPYAKIVVTYTTMPGTHTLGLVQTDGPCQADSYGRESCISGTNGYVLAEGQEALNLQPGDNGATTMILRGVMQSAYLCDENCDGHAGSYSANGYDIFVFVADESGDTIPFQKDANSNPVPFDNGSYQVVEQDGNNVVTISKPGPFSSPGTDAHNLYGVEEHIACNKVGTTTVAAELLSTDPSVGSVTGFNYTANNYPAAGSVLSSVGADQFYGNTLSVNCTATGSITVE